MPIFISYSHTDKEFVDELALSLVHNHVNVWVDRWEINVGDSILNKVQEAIQSSSALLVILSKASVQSEWCKKELSAGLIRELEEKRVIILPVLIEDCEIPIFLKDKYYADFRTDFDNGTRLILNAIARITNLNQGRIDTPKAIVDWGHDWGYIENNFVMHFVIVETLTTQPFTILIQVGLKCDDLLTKRYKLYEEINLDWIGRLVLLESIPSLAKTKDIRVLLKSEKPESINLRLEDKKLGSISFLEIKCRRLGEDPGNDQLVDIGATLLKIHEIIKASSRQPTKDELLKMSKIMSSS